MDEKSSTLERIYQAAMEEFLGKGFQEASLRRIVKNAGVTTGALYGYFSSKEALFAALVEPHAAAVLGRFMAAQDTFANLPEGEQPGHVGRESSDCVLWMVDYIYRNFDAFKLLICHAQGTAYEHFVHHMVEVEVGVEATARYLEVLSGGTSRCRSWTPSSVISSPAGCSIASLKSSSAICPMSGPSAMWRSSRRFIWPDDKNEGGLPPLHFCHIISYN